MAKAGTSDIYRGKINVNTLKNRVVPEIVQIKKTQISSKVVITGYAIDLDAATSEPAWLIERDIDGEKEWSGDQYDSVFDNANDLIFGAVPFANRLSIQFDGANDFIDVDHNEVFNFDFRSEAMSIGLWMKTPNTFSNKTYLEKQLSNVGFRFHLSIDDLTLELRGTGGASDRIRVRTPSGDSAGTTLNNGLWHYIAATYDGSGLASGVKLFIDGVPTNLDVQNDALVTDTKHTGNMAIGARAIGSDNFGPGNIDEVSIWDVELSEADILQIYNGGNPIDLQGQELSPITTSLVYWSRMGDGGNDIYPTTEDVANGVLGTMTNMTSGDIETEVPSA